MILQGKSPLRKTYKGVIFLPGGKPIEDGRLNLWTGFAVKPKRGDWSLMREHIRIVLAAGNEDLDAYIIRWLADLMQRPNQQAGAALVFRGGQEPAKASSGVPSAASSASTRATYRHPTT